MLGHLLSNGRQLLRARIVDVELESNTNRTSFQLLLLLPGVLGVVGRDRWRRAKMASLLTFFVEGSNIVLATLLFFLRR